jgi:hypothetical protein
MFEPSKFIQYEDGTRKKIFEWYGINIRCELYPTQNQTSEWSFQISGINGFAEDELRLDYSIGKYCTKRTLADAMKRMFQNKYKDAYHKIIKGILCGKIINNTLYLGIK